MDRITFFTSYACSNKYIVNFNSCFLNLLIFINIALVYKNNVFKVALFFIIVTFFTSKLFICIMKNTSNDFISISLFYIHIDSDIFYNFVSLHLHYNIYTINKLKAKNYESSLLIIYTDLIP